MRNLPFLALALLVAAPALAAPPRIEAKAIDGSQFRLADPGSVTVVNFWATWCVPCRAELPAFDAWFQAHRKDGVRLLAISMDDPALAAKVSRLAAAWHFQVAMADAVTMPASLRPNALPVTLVYDRSGALRYDSRKKPGPLDQAALERITAPLLAVPRPR